jgi:Divergent InlB B-repeat domain
MAPLLRRVAAAPSSLSGKRGRGLTIACLLAAVAVLPGATGTGKSDTVRATESRISSSGGPGLAVELQENLTTIAVLPSLWGQVFVDPPAFEINQEVVTDHCDSLYPLGPFELLHCFFQYEVGTRVTLTARADEGQRFFGWGAVECPGRQACELTVGKRRSITALFTPAPLALDVAVAEGAEGVIISNPPGILCRTSPQSLEGFCTAPFRAGRPLTLTAMTHNSVDWYGCSPMRDNPKVCKTDSGTPFVGVGIGDVYPGPPFGEETKLIVLKRGRGRVTGPDIRCGLDCAEWYPTGRRVTLTATPRPGRIFKRWEGGVYCPVRTCQFSVGPVNSVRAVFRRP